MKSIQNCTEQKKNPKDIKSLFGLAGYNRQFIPNFVEISKLLIYSRQQDVSIIFLTHELSDKIFDFFLFFSNKGAVTMNNLYMNHMTSELRKNLVDL